MPLISADAFGAMSRTLLTAAGASAEDAAVIADSVRWATLRGNESHGVDHLPMYVRMYAHPEAPPRVNRAGTYEITRQGDAVVTIDGHGCAGQRVLRDAAALVARRAAVGGVALATTIRTTHHGALGYALEPILERDMIGLIFAGSGAATPAFGGTDRKLGTNPIAIGVPAGDREPIIIDMATSASTWLGLLDIWRTDADIPEGLILDGDGNPTTDRSGFVFGFRSQDGEPKGALSTIGNSHKGYALQLAVEMLGGILPALISGNEVGTDGYVSALVIAIRVGAVQDATAFKERVDRRLEELKRSVRKAGVEEIWIPGERGFATSARRSADGIPIGEAEWGRLERVASEVGVDLAPFTQAAEPA